MIDLIFYTIIVCLILSFDKKLSGNSLRDNIKHNFNFKKSIGYSLAFMSLLLFIYYLLAVKEIIIINFHVKLNFKLISYVLLSCLISPFVEEYIFRYIPYKLFNKSTYKYGMIFLSIIVFTFVHNGNSVEYILILMSAIMLTYMMFKEENILYSFFSHSLYNTAMIISLLFYSTLGHIYIYLFLILFVIGTILLTINSKKKKI